LEFMISSPKPWILIVFSICMLLKASEFFFQSESVSTRNVSCFPVPELINGTKILRLSLIVSTVGIFYISWTLMLYGQYKQVALTTTSNACYARSPKPIWASKRNRGHGKRRHNNSQFKIHPHIEWLVT